jgi:hypothetical protein
VARSYEHDNIIKKEEFLARFSIIGFSKRFDSMDTAGKYIKNIQWLNGEKQ